MSIKETPLEKLVEEIKKAKLVQEEMKQAESILKAEIMDRLNVMKVSGTKVGNTLITIAKRISFPDVSLLQAEEWGCITKKKDEVKLRKLLDKGVDVKFTETQYLFIKEQEEK